MPALNPSHTQRLTLANGLTLNIRHEPRLPRSAAFLRVAAGSHDVPAAWPGLAHFLEHLLFLGTDHFAAANGLMAYVQQHGGLINARTNERHTDFFFELPPEALEGGLERLCDMLAHPRMALDDQLREREVLHAEFIAWARDPSAQRELALLEPLNPAHPLRAFHAGNRYSLPVPRANFQAALTGFHQRFYHTGQISLSLTGPQPVEALKTLAERHTAHLPRGQAVHASTPPPLMSDNPRHCSQIDGPRLNMMFAFEHVPAALEQALDFLCVWINADKPGGLVAHLRQHALINTVKATVMYQFEGQALLNIAFTARTGLAPHTQQIEDILFDWLAFFSAQRDWPTLREAYGLRLQRQQQVSRALDLARFDAEQRELQLSEQGVTALNALLEQMQPTPRAIPSAHWQLPGPNPFLSSQPQPVTAGLIRGQTSAHRGLRTFAQDRLRSRRDVTAMTFSTAVPAQRGEAAIYLRWHLHVTPADTLLMHLQNSLQSVQHDAREAGVELSLTAQGNDWLLMLRGFHEPMPSILEHTLRVLSAPTAEHQTSTPDAPLMPIRHLLKRLPEVHQARARPKAGDVATCWASARWDGLALGIPVAAHASVSSVLNKAPGTPDAQLTPPHDAPTHPQWHTESCGLSEHAVLLFCPAPLADLTTEAAWRLLAHVMQTPFYQRLRVELQLGYAVFSGLRQLNGRTGLLLGVQSPTTSASEIFEHMQHFLSELPTLISALDETAFQQARETFAQQFSPHALSLQQTSELLWQAKLAGHSSDYLHALLHALKTLDQATTLDAAQRVSQPQSGWLCLSTGSVTETFYLGRS